MTDLPVSTAPGQEYGARAEQERAQQVVPMGTTPQPQPMRPPPPALNAPTQRPNEPVQAGLASGPGAGPEALGAMNGEQLTVDTLRALRRKFPSPTLDGMLLKMMGR